MRRLIGGLLRRIHVDDCVRNVRGDISLAGKRLIWGVRRNLGRNDKHLIQEYLKCHKTRLLQVGCGKNSLKGWLNSDLYPEDHGVLHLNATKGFPFDSGVFDYVYSEHMIEHVAYAQACNMASECFRILRPGGRIRISTPNMQFLLDIYSNPSVELHAAYIDWSKQIFLGENCGIGATHVVNNFFRDWGHQFIYDERSLSDLLSRSGFSDIHRCEVNCSEDPHFCGLENENRMPNGFLALESLIIEARKSA